MATAKTQSLLDVSPSILPPLDPSFRPAILASDRYQKAVAKAKGIPVVLVLERSAGEISRWDLRILPPGSANDGDTLRYVERTLKFLLWSHGACKVYLSAPPFVGEYIRDIYSFRGRRSFDVELMTQAFDRPFQVKLVDERKMPEAKQTPSLLGGHWDGCRIGFDLGASDYKIAAVDNGKLIFSKEIPWNPKDEPDHDYHYQKIQDGLTQAASHLPCVDAIGGSSAGIYLDSRVMVASLFRSVPKDRFEKHVRSMFLRLREQWNTPLQVINDGDVTALAGALSMKKKAKVFGIAMGSSEAVGYLNAEGRVTGWLNELAFAPVDYNPHAPPDEWSKDYGVGANYFSQQAVNRLAIAAGMSFPPDMDIPTRLCVVQEQVNAGDEAASKVFESIGVYLGYTVPYYCRFYDINHMLVLGRVTSGMGGELIIKNANEVLAQEFPKVKEAVTLVVPDEESRRVGQAFAAASLPEIAAAG